MFEKKADTRVPIDDRLAHRWSGRAFDPDRPVAGKDILALMEAARWSPSCFGDEPWRYVVCDRRNDPEAWQRACDCLGEGNRAWASSAPLLVLAVAKLRFSSNDKPNRWAQYDTGAAGMSLCVQATEPCTRWADSTRTWRWKPSPYRKTTSPWP